MPITAAQLIVKCLESEGVKYVFGIPGAKIDAVFNALEDSSIKLIVCRHEQNAAFIAAAYGRLTGKPGIVLVTSGPGVTNLTTGLLTATTEGDPVIALAGSVSRDMHLKDSHQNANAIKLLEAATKSSVEVATAESVPEAIANAFRTAQAPRAGACLISLPQDILAQETHAKPIVSLTLPSYGLAPQATLEMAAKLIHAAKLPVLLLGEEASRPTNAKAIVHLLEHISLPTVSTYQAAGVIPRTLVQHFVGRVGLFKTQPGDALLSEADLVLTVGFNAVEYDPEIWHVNQDKTIVHLDYLPANIRTSYAPRVEVLGDIASNVNALIPLLQPRKTALFSDRVNALQAAYMKTIESGKDYQQSPIHPLRFIHELREAIDDETYVLCDVGTIYMWMARYFLCYQPRHLLFSNGQQTLGVGLPFAMATAFAYPDKPIVSLSGDGGFLFSAVELETAVREKLNFVHFVWTDGSYNMVAEQELMKYKRTSGVALGPVNIPDFAKAFGAHGFELSHADDFKRLFKEAQAIRGPVLINVAIDYSDNVRLFKEINPHHGH